MRKSLEATTSGAQSSATEYEYDVFLSFRGPDVRQGFVDCLRHRLVENGIRVFVDQEELRPGEEIGRKLLTAIENSKIYIPIFSKNYASSKWCLQELEHMVKCRKSSAQAFAPIFYDVEPCDVKLKTQRYEGALDALEKQFGRERRLKCEDALKSAGEIKGWELDSQGSRCLRELEDVVEWTKSELSRQVIMPIFYDVKPSDVKLKTRRYKGALDKHEEQFGRERRLKWEDALKSAGQIKGWELKSQGFSKFIRSVTDDILMKLKMKDKLVTEHLVRMDNPVKDVEKLFDVDSRGMRAALSHGMGGIGNTTLAKIACNKLNSHFSHCCLPKDVWKCCSTPSKLLKNDYYLPWLVSALMKKPMASSMGSRLPSTMGSRPSRSCFVRRKS